MGECKANPSWMLKNCRVSCNECKNKCADHHEHCTKWASLGECGKNPFYMNVYCARSCKKCTVKSNCEDEKDDCPYWATKKKFCTDNKYQAFMQLRCKKSCNLCVP